MKTACGVIRDLLPLYAEKLTGEESDALIREHLSECKKCSDYLEKIMNPVDGGISPEDTVSSENCSLKLVNKGIRRRKTTAVMFSVLLVFLAMLTAFSHVVKPDYASYQDSGVAVVNAENGDVYAQFSDSVTSCKVTRSLGEDGASVVEIAAWTSLWDKILAKSAPAVLISSNDEKADVAYYCDLSSEENNMTVIYGADAVAGIIVLPRLVLGYYFIAALAAAAVLGLVWFILRKNKRAGRICGYLFAAPLSYELGHLIITTGFTSFSATGDFIMNCIAALAIYGILTLGASLLRQHRQDTVTE